MACLRSSMAHAKIAGHRRVGRARARGRRPRLHRQGLPRAGRLHLRLAGHRRHQDEPLPGDLRRRGEVRRRRRGRRPGHRQVRRRRRPRPHRRRLRAPRRRRRHGGGAQAAAPRSSTPRWAPTSATSRRCRAATTRPRKAKADVVVKRRFINQRLIPNPMEPRAVVAAPMGMSDELTIWSATQIPHVLRVLLALLTGIPENNIRVIAPDVGGGFGAKLQIYREEVLALVLASEARQADQVDRDPQREHGRHAPRPRPDPGHRARRHQRRQDPRHEGRPAGRHGRLPADHHAGHPAARHVHVHRHLQDGGARLHLHRRLHDEDADRRLPRRRSSGGDVRHRAHRRRGSRPSSASSRWSSASRTGSSTRSSPTRRSRGSPTTAATTRRPPRAPSSSSATTSCARSRPHVGPPATRSSSASASRRSPRCAASRRRAPSAR